MHNNINEQKKAFEILNSQVCNGGFQQWLMNGYGKLAEATIEALEAIGSANALSVADIVKKVVSEIEINGDDENYIYEPEFADFADQLDSQYYNVSDALQKDAKAHFGQESKNAEKLSKTQIKKLVLEKVKEETGLTVNYGPCLKNNEKIKLAEIDLDIPPVIAPAFKKLQLVISAKVIDTGIMLNLDYFYSHFRGWNGVLTEFFYNFADKEWKQYS
jgi:hypothetical protein